MISVSFIYNRKKTTGKTAGIEVRVTHMRKSYYISTGVRVRKSEWKNGMVINRPDCNELNDRLALVVANIQQAVNLCLQEERPLDVVAIKKQAWNMQNDDVRDDEPVMTWLSEQIPMLNLASKTRERYLVLYRRLVEFGRFSQWTDMTVENIYSFDDWLRQRPSQNGTGYISDAGVHNYHKCLKSLLNRAVRFGVIAQNPYERLKGQIKRGDKRSVEYLTEDEMQAFQRLCPAPGTMAARAHDLFVFQMYTGLSYSDTQVFELSNYKKVNGRWAFNGLRIKTGVPYVSELLPPVVDVLERNGWKVPRIDNADYNKLLKVLGMAAGITTRLHSHVARHTFATWALSHGVKIQNVSAMLGHTNITQTQRYAKVLAESVHNDFELLSKQIKQ